MSEEEVRVKLAVIENQIVTMTASIATLRADMDKGLDRAADVSKEADERITSEMEKQKKTVAGILFVVFSAIVTEVLRRTGILQ